MQRDERQFDFGLRGYAETTRPLHANPDDRERPGQQTEGPRQDYRGGYDRLQESGPRGGRYPDAL